MRRGRRCFRQLLFQQLETAPKFDVTREEWSAAKFVQLLESILVGAMLSYNFGTTHSIDHERPPRVTTIHTNRAATSSTFSLTPAWCDALVNGARSGRSCGASALRC